MLTSQLSPPAAAQLLLNRRRIRASFTEFCEHALAPYDQAPARHHRLLISELEAIARGDNDRLMVFMPPGSAKSTYASVLFPAWFLAQSPGLNIIGASNTDSLAALFSRRIQAVIRDNEVELGYSLTRESAELWATSTGCEYRAAGVGTAIAGYRASLVVIDDPIRSREEAESETAREKLWAWFSADLRSRLKPNAAIVLIQTRWHQDDLGGRLLETQGNRWRVLKLPATAQEDDPLGRAPGELLWADTPDYPYAEELARVRAEAQQNGAMRDWWALYEQDPRPAEGGLFRPDKLRIVDEAPAGGAMVRAWDLAASEKVGTRDPDATAGVKLCRHPDGSFTILDVIRLQGGPDRVEKTILETAALDGHSVAISLPQDPGSAGKTLALHLVRKLAGFRVEATPETGAKATRAAVFASQCNGGNVALVRASWNYAFIDELRSFPGGRHDDMVDAASRSFAALVSPPPPMKWMRMPFLGR